MYNIQHFDKQSMYMTKIQKILLIIIYIIIIPLLLISIILITRSIFNIKEMPYIFGTKSYMIVSKSMEPTIRKNDVIIVKKVEKEDLKINDIISFHDRNIINTHRIVDIEEDNGKVYYKTKGDNNINEDKQMREFEDIEGKYKFKLNQFGSIIGILKSKETLVVILMLLILVMIYQIRLNKRKLKRKQIRYEYKNNKIK